MITVLPVIPPSSKDLINPVLTPQKHDPISSIPKYIYMVQRSNHPPTPPAMVTGQP